MSRDGGGTWTRAHTPPGTDVGGVEQFNTDAAYSSITRETCGRSVVADFGPGGSPSTRSSARTAACAGRGPMSPFPGFVERCVGGGRRGVGRPPAATARANALAPSSCAGRRRARSSSNVPRAPWPASSALQVAAGDADTAYVTVTAHQQARRTLVTHNAGRSWTQLPSPCMTTAADGVLRSAGRDVIWELCPLPGTRGHRDRQLDRRLPLVPRATSRGAGEASRTWCRSRPGRRGRSPTAGWSRVTDRSRVHLAQGVVGRRLLAARPPSDRLPTERCRGERVRDPDLGRADPGRRVPHARRRRVVDGQLRAGSVTEVESRCQSGVRAVAAAGGWDREATMGEQTVPNLAHTSGHRAGACASLWTEDPTLTHTSFGSSGCAQMWASSGTRDQRIRALAAAQHDRVSPCAAPRCRHQLRGHQHASGPRPAARSSGLRLRARAARHRRGQRPLRRYWPWASRP